MPLPTPDELDAAYSKAYYHSIAHDPISDPDERQAARHRTALMAVMDAVLEHMAADLDGHTITTPGDGDRFAAVLRELQGGV